LLEFDVDFVDYLGAAFAAINDAAISINRG
jgi:hypothetical protein